MDNKAGGIHSSGNGMREAVCGGGRAHLLDGFEGLALLDAEDPAGVAVHHRRVGENIQQQHRPCADAQDQVDLVIGRGMSL